MTFTYTPVAHGYPKVANVELPEGLRLTDADREILRQAGDVATRCAIACRAAAHEDAEAMFDGIWRIAYDLRDQVPKEVS